MDEELVENVIHDVCRAFKRTAIDFEDDDVFLAESDVYTDMNTTRSSGNIRPQSVEIHARRTSDVIDCLGEETVTLRSDDPSSSSRPCTIPVSPRSRNSSDLGYSGSPFANHFSFPAGGMSMAAMHGNTPDSRPITFYDEDENARARAPVDREADAYNMGHPRRGRAIIFNHDTFDNELAAPRHGSLTDVAEMERAFCELQFQVHTYHNLTHQQIKLVMRDLALEDHSDADCLAITVLSHGMDSGLLYARDALYPVDTLWKNLTADACVTLAGKPKIFFLQACRGEKSDRGVNLVSMGRPRSVSMSETDSGPTPYKIPRYGDFLISYSSWEGFVSWRNREQGTWYIQSLAKELRQLGSTRNITDILTRVNRRVALWHESQNEDFGWMCHQKQCPIFHSSLMRDLIFLPKT